MGRWNPERWVQSGTNEGGDPVYVRSGSSESLGSLSKAELQELAEQRGLAKSGTKDELIERLQG